jgi:glycosidase
MKPPSWSERAVFYHIHPLGLCGAPEHNDFRSEPEPRLEKIHGWIGHLVSMGIDACYLGPLFESGSHGYDVADYYRVDRRLGTWETAKALIEDLHRNGIRVVLDGVFHHVGRNHHAFRDLQTRGQASPHREWFAGLDFSRRSPAGDPFWYEGWHGHYDLAKLNLGSRAVRDHLFGAVEAWIDELGIDGLRLDAADSIDFDFLRELGALCRSKREDFWLLGEVIRGDYRRWTDEAELDSVTNYECYKGLWSSHNDANYFEIAHSLNRQFGPGGIYEDLRLYNFVDNHDVKRIASQLVERSQLFPLYCLLFTIPGIPSVYYGSEYGIRGEKERHSDAPLRPALELGELQQDAPVPELVDVIRRLAALRATHPALQHGAYREMRVAHRQLAFLRYCEEEALLVVVNSALEAVAMDLSPPQEIARAESAVGTQAYDVLNAEAVAAAERTMRFEVPATWARVISLPQHSG